MGHFESLESCRESIEIVGEILKRIALVKDAPRTRARGSKGSKWIVRDMDIIETLDGPQGSNAGGLWFVAKATLARRGEDCEERAMEAIREMWKCVDSLTPAERRAAALICIGSPGLDELLERLPSP